MHEVVVVLNKVPEAQAKKVLAQVIPKLMHKVNSLLRVAQRVNSPCSVEFFCDLSSFVAKA